MYSGCDYVTPELSRSSGSRCENYRNVIYREVVVVEVASSELGNSWTLAEKVRDSFLLMSTKEAFFCVRFVHAVEVFIQATVSSD